MIAYNHYIKFIPKLKNAKKVEDSFRDVIIIKEIISNDFEDKLKFELSFLQNQGRELVLYTDREFARTQIGQLWVFEVKNVVTFSWYSGTLNIGYIKYGDFTEKLLEYWCLHIFLPLFLTIEETYVFLHAGAVDVDEKRILFVADSFGGKSTMTDFFMKQGHVFISDDKVATYENNGQFFAVPSHPHHRPYRNTEDLGFVVEKFATEPKPISAIYELEKVAKNAEISIVEVKGIEKFKSLRFSSEINVYFHEAKRFKYLMQMAQKVPVYKIKIPWDLTKLEEVYNQIYTFNGKIK